MQYGSPLPIRAFDDIAAVRAYARALDDAGFDFTSTSGHVMAQPSGTNPQRPDRQYVGPFYDPFVTFGYLSAVTRRLRFITGILILPAWPTVLAAKQAAELALFSGGRFELGVGLSWNPAEYRALGQSFQDRGKRLEEQLSVLRLLWTRPYVSFDGQWHQLEQVGLNRGNLPKIPIWFGSETGDSALRRVARFADGWMSLGDPTPDLPRLHRFMQEAGRDPKELMVRAPLVVSDGGKADWIARARTLQAAGVTHLNLVCAPDIAANFALTRILEAHQALKGALG